MGSFAVATHNNKILLILRSPDDSFPNHWFWVGGGEEDGETPEQTLVRELKEEANLDISDYQHLFSFESFSQPELLHHIYHVPLNETHLQNLRLGDEGQKLDFFSLEEIDTLLLPPGMKKIMGDYKDLVKKVVI